MHRKSKEPCVSALAGEETILTMANWHLKAKTRGKQRACFLISGLLVLAFMFTACGSSALPKAKSASSTATPTASTNLTPSSESYVPPAQGKSFNGIISPCPEAGSAAALNGAGATFPGPLYTRWFDEYNKLCGIRINYQAIGSGGGIKQITEKTVDFGASDGIMTSKQKEKAPGTIMIPMTSGPVAIVVNLPEFRPGQLRLSPETLSGIFLGTLTRWDDPRIAADNPGLALPNRLIAVVRRSDGSGTTNIFTTYLSDINADWRGRVGAGNSVQWPTGLGGEGNAGVAGLVKQIPGSIGYVELAYAKQNKMTWVALKNQAGNYIEPTLETATAASDGVAIPDSTEVMLTNSANPNAYPIVGLTWIIVYVNQTDVARAQTLASVLWWAVHDGQKIAMNLGYPPLSSGMVQKAEVLIGRINVDGQAVLR
jgi:phosphate transport system substrate-binding protein